MRETFPHKRAGDRLSVGHINALSAVCRRMAMGGSGAFASGYTGSFNGQSSLPNFVQEVLKIEEDLGDGLYRVRVRYYEADTESWATGDVDYTLDASDVGGVYAVSDKVVAFWHAQRDAYVPLGSSATLILRVGKAAGVIPVDSETGRVTIWEDGVATDTVVENVHHDWITNNTAIADEDEVIIGWFSGESVWRVIGAEC